MATYAGSSDVSWGSTHASTKSSPVETSPLEGYADVPSYGFTGIPDLRKHVKSQSKALVAGRTTHQYLTFRGVTKDHLAQIDRERASIGKHTRMTHYTDIDLLIIKLMPSGKHEAAHVIFSDEVNRKLEGMGLPKRSLFGFGSRTCVGPNSSKEGDSTYQPKCRPGKSKWPTLAFEAELSESLTKLRRDAEWWLTASNGEVKIAIVISIVPAEKSLRIEQWCMSLSTGRPATRAYTANPTVPTKIQELTVIQNPLIPPLPGTIPTYTVTGAPLILEFEKLLLRAPVLPEGNVIFTAADLQALAEEFWFMIG
jgi:hypothetical protein